MAAAQPRLPVTGHNEVAQEDTMITNANVENTGMMTVMSRRGCHGRSVKSAGGFYPGVPLFLRWSRIKEFLILILSSFSSIYP
jgi:hypothetical protein